MKNPVFPLIVFLLLAFAGCSSPSGGGGNPPSAPGGFRLSKIADGEIELSWDTASGATEYEVLIGTTNDASSAVSLGTVSTESFTVDTTNYPGLSNGTEYYFWVRANNSNGSSPLSAALAGTPMAAGQKPVITGMNPQAVTGSGLGTIHISWTKTSTADSYKVYVSTSTTRPADAELTGNISECNITGLNTPDNYNVWVSASNDNGETIPSSYVSAATVPPVANPTGVSLTNPPKGPGVSLRLMLKYTQTPGVDWYEYYISTSSVAPTLATPPTSNCVYQTWHSTTGKVINDIEGVGPLTGDTTYYVWIRGGLGSPPGPGILPIPGWEPGLWTAAGSCRVYNNQASLSSFSISGQTSVEISGNNIAVTMPWGSDVTNVVPTVGGISTGATISPVAGTARDFTTSQTYTITPEDEATTRTYTVQVKIASSGTIQYTAPGDETINLSGQSIPWTDDGIITVNAPATPVYDSYAWFVDGAAHTGGYLSNGGKTLKKPVVELPPGTHTITLRVLKDSVPYTKVVTLTISIPE